MLAKPPRHGGRVKTLTPRPALRVRSWDRHSCLSPARKGRPSRLLDLRSIDRPQCPSSPFGAMGVNCTGPAWAGGARSRSAYGWLQLTTPGMHQFGPEHQKHGRGGLRNDFDHAVIKTLRVTAINRHIQRIIPKTRRGEARGRADLRGVRRRPAPDASIRLIVGPCRVRGIFATDRYIRRVGANFQPPRPPSRRALRDHDLPDRCDKITRSSGQPTMPISFLGMGLIQG